MKLQEDDVIMINYRKLNYSPIVKKKDWFEANKEALRRDGWRLPTRMHLKQILKENDIEAFKKPRKKSEENIETKED